MICRQTVTKSGGHADGQILLQERLTKDDAKTDWPTDNVTGRLKIQTFQIGWPDRLTD